MKDNEQIMTHIFSVFLLHTSHGNNRSARKQWIEYNTDDIIQYKV